MAEYIKREAALSEIEDMISNIAFSSPYQSDIATLISGMERVRDCVENAGAADVAPVRHGRWLYVDTDTEQFFLCNRCKKKEYWESNYCPNCGAKMDLI